MNNMNGRHHTFDSGMARAYGVEESVLIQHFQHWIAFNKSQGKNFREGRTWMFQSRKQMIGYLNYWNHDKIKYLCEKLVKLGILITNNFSKNRLDRTLWYAFADEKAFGITSENKNNITKEESAQSETYFEKPTNSQKETTVLKECLRKGTSAHRLGKSAHCYKDKDTKEDTKEEEEIMSAPPASVRLALFFFDLLLQFNPKTKKPDIDLWAKDLDTMMRVDKRTEDEIMSIFKYMTDQRRNPTGTFTWLGVVQSPNKLRKQFDVLWMQMTSKTPLKVNTTEDDKKLVKNIENKLGGQFGDMNLGNNYIEFINSGASPSHYFTCGEKDFKNKVLEQLQRRKLPIEGLL